MAACPGQLGQIKEEDEEYETDNNSSNTYQTVYRTQHTHVDTPRHSFTNNSNNSNSCMMSSVGFDRTRAYDMTPTKFRNFLQRGGGRITNNNNSGANYTNKSCETLHQSQYINNSNYQQNNNDISDHVTSRMTPPQTVETATYVSTNYSNREREMSSSNIRHMDGSGSKRNIMNGNYNGVPTHSFIKRPSTVNGNSMPRNCNNSAYNYNNSYQLCNEGSQTCASPEIENYSENTLNQMNNLSRNNEVINENTRKPAQTGAIYTATPKPKQYIPYLRHRGKDFHTNTTITTASTSPEGSITKSDSNTYRAACISTCTVTTPVMIDFPDLETADKTNGRSRATSRNNLSESRNENDRNILYTKAETAHQQTQQLIVENNENSSAESSLDLNNCSVSADTSQTSSNGANITSSSGTGSSLSSSENTHQMNSLSEDSSNTSDINTSSITTGSDPSSSNNSSQISNKTEPMTFGDPRQRQVFDALTGIQSLRKDGVFSDVTIKVKNREFKCHRFVLSNSSPFFRNLLNNIKNSDKNSSNENSNATKKKQHMTGDKGNDLINESDDGVDGADNSEDKADINKELVEETEQKNETIIPKDQAERSCNRNDSVITLKGVEPAIFEKVLDFIYCVFDDVISDNSELELLLAADTFQLTNLSQACVTHIADTVNTDTVYDVISLVDSGSTSLSDNKVRVRCHQVFRENFLQLSCRNEFLGLSRQRMISLTADSMLVIKNEIDLIPALIRWVDVRPCERSADLTLMLQLIRFPLMSSEDLDKLLEMPYLQETSLAKALIEESRAYSMKDFPEKMSWPRQNCISRCNFPSRDFILWTADRDKGLHLYSIIDGQHYKVTSFNEATVDKVGFTFDSTATVCCYGDRLFFTGGEFNTDLAWSIDSATGEVAVHSKMPRGRKFHSMVVSRGCVYCLGGQDKRGYTVLDSVDAYITNKDIWVKVGHMAVAAYNMAAVVSGGAIYLIGGIDHAGQPLKLVQCFVVLRSGLYSAFKVDIVNMPPSLLSPRAATSGLDASVYIVSGHGEVYRLDAEKRSLHHTSTLKSLNNSPRFRFGLAHVGGCLVVNGGHQLGHMKHEPVRSVCMDIATKAEVKDYSPLLPADIVNTCFYAKLNSGILGYSKLSCVGH